MSLCPSKDIHSVYLDNELPEVYKAEYEAHVNSCAACKAELNKLKAVREVFQNDSNQITPDSHYLDKSYERLMVKMSYSKNTGIQNKRNHSFKNITYFASAAVAAAVVAVVLPVRMNGAKGVTPSSVVSVNNGTTLSNGMSASALVASGNNVSFNSGNSRVISGNINESVLTSSNQGTNASAGNMIRDVDFFRPDFDENETISVKITMPGMNSVPVTREIHLPAEVMSGRF